MATGSTTPQQRAIAEQHRRNKLHGSNFTVDVDDPPEVFTGPLKQLNELGPVLDRLENFQTPASIQRIIDNPALQKRV